MAVTSPLTLAALGTALVIGAALGAIAMAVRSQRLQGELAGLRQRREEDATYIESLRAECRRRDEQLHEQSETLSQLRQENAQLKATLEQERQHHGEKVKMLEEARQQLSDSFKALSAEALQANSQTFLDQAKQTLQQQHDQAKSEVMKPLQDHLKRLEEQVQHLEKARAGAYEGLKGQVAAMQKSQQHLQEETSRLVKALRRPEARGRWGEMQLRRVVEMADMMAHVSFVEQAGSEARDSRAAQRPDMIVRLPGERSIVVDAKTPVDAFLDAMEAEDDETRAAQLARHAKQVREHMRTLGSKGYWKNLDSSPDFVVMFLPGENFFSAALDKEPGLIEAGVSDHVIPATPTTLIALLRAVAYGWRQERLAENARQAAQLGQDLYDRLGVLAGHMAGVGKNLRQTVESYNKAVGSLESRVLVSARRFKELDVAAGAGELPTPEPIDRQPRSLQTGELAVGDDTAPGDSPGS